MCSYVPNKGEQMSAIMVIKAIRPVAELKESIDDRIQCVL